MKYNFDFIGSRKIWFALSGVVILAGIVAMIVNWTNPAIRSPLKLGIDFTGGTEIRVKMPAEFTVDDAASRLKEFSLERQDLKRSEDELIVTTQNTGSEYTNRLVDTLKKDYGVKTQDVSIDMVGPSIGRELQRNGLIGLLLGMLGVLFYVTIRYDFKFAVSAIAALFHDVLVMMGFFALTRIDVNSFFVPAVLTVVGYSINDTIVIFDRIRENVKLDRRADFGQTVNLSINQTLSRSINTSLTTGLCVVALLVFGGATIHSFALALFVGITSGAYSSIFNASQILVSWKLAEGGRAKASKKVAADETATAARAYAVQSEAVPVGVGSDGVAVKATADAAKVARKRAKKKRY